MGPDRRTGSFQDIDDDFWGGELFGDGASGRIILCALGFGTGWFGGVDSDRVYDG